MADQSQRTRRQFLWHTAIAGAVAACAAVTRARFAEPTFAAAGADEAVIPIVDTHQHLWDLKRFRLPWLDGAGDVLNRDYLMADYLKAADGLNVVRAVYMEVAVTPDQRLAEAEYVVDLCRRGGTPTVAAVIGGSPAADDFPAYINRFKGSPHVKGVRESLRPGSSTDKSFLSGIRRLGELGMSFDLLHGPDLLAEAAAVAKACPDTRFILDHCGNADPRQFRTTADSAARRQRRQWEDGVSALAERSNVVCKISGVMEAAAPDKVTADDVAPVVNHCLDRFGPDRVIFSSNWPVCNGNGSFSTWLSLLGVVLRARSNEARRKLFHDNALRIYSIA
jgi:predicted TIM-barrel fold metal-dependent hydrolase